MTRGLPLEEMQNSGTIAALLPAQGVSVGSENIFADSIGLMILGMGTVFVFLSVLVIVTSLMSSLVQKYVIEDASSELAKISSSGQDQQTLLTVISAAIHAHRSRKNN